MFNLKPIAKVASKALFNVKKNSPLILTGVGVVGLVGTAVLSYKSAKKIEVITANMEEARENYEEIDKGVIVRDVIAATAAPVLLGIGSIAAILGSYHVLSGRNSALASAIAGALAENRNLKSRLEKYEVKKDYVNAPVKVTETEEVKEDGKKVKVNAIDKVEIPNLHGVWFDQSDEYVSDDNQYNHQFISASSKLLEDKLIRRGYLTLNEVYDQLGLPRDKKGAIFGWSEDSYPFLNWQLDAQTIKTSRPGEEYHADIYVSWPEPCYVYNNIKFDID